MHAVAHRDHAGLTVGDAVDLDEAFEAGAHHAERPTRPAADRGGTKAQVIAGEQRGGHGFQRVYEILEDGVTFATYADRFELAPQPLFGGVAGRTAQVMVERDGETIRLASKQSFALRRGDRLIMRTGGGAGYGDPCARSERARRGDADDGLAPAVATA